MIYTRFLDIPSHRYWILYADPPWAYRDEGINGSAAGQYQTMNIDELCRLPVSRIAADDALLFMWTTPPTLPDAFQLGTSWGFKYKTKAFTWLKYRGQKPMLGLGHWTRGNTEDCYLFTRGNPSVIRRDISQVIETTEDVLHAPVGKHSAKPSEARKRIVRLCGDFPRIELFSRQEVYGWDAFGNQVQPAP